MIKKVFLWMKGKIAPRMSRLQTKKARKKFKKLEGTADFSIISQNCIGGVMYHDLGLKFLSPTINAYMSALDFIKFCENLEYYCSINAEDILFVEERQYPVGFLGDIKIYFVHYKTKDEVIQKWNDRRQRINFKKIRIVMTDRDGLDEGLLRRFLKLPYKKILFSAKDYGVPEINYMPCFKKQICVGVLTAYYSFSGKRYYEKYFDYIKWLAE